MDRVRGHRQEENHRPYPVAGAKVKDDLTHTVQRRDQDRSCAENQPLPAGPFPIGPWIRYAKQSRYRHENAQLHEVCGLVPNRGFGGIAYDLAPGYVAEAQDQQ